MICKVCGRKITNEDANFCEYCGSSFRPGTDNKIVDEILRSQNVSSYDQDSNRQGYKEVEGQQETNRSSKSKVMPQGFARGFLDSSDRPMTFGNWILIYLLPFIPVVGMIFFLVVLFTWGFGSNASATKKNWARATIVMLIIILLMVSLMLSSGYLGDPEALLNSIYGGRSL